MQTLVRAIHRLDPLTVNQIAAGEVVERPASVVKELVENALDSGATKVVVELEDNGRRAIRVSDDGCGMGPADLHLAVERHATSKITSADDLMSVGTLGFRGEALPSIGSVARMTIRTATQAGIRHVLRVEGGEIQDCEPEGGPPGTDVLVEDLFFNTPARLKFLRSDATELSACIEVISKYAVGYPQVRFVARHQGTTLLETSGSDDPLTALAEVWGREPAKALAPVDLFTGYARVTGFVSPPHYTRPTRSMQWMFVNGRPVRSRALTAALDQAFKSLTPERRHPLALLMIHVDPAKVDVNVSPTKTEVRFHHEGSIFEAVRRSVRDALLSTGMVPTLDAVVTANDALRAVQSALEPHASFASSMEAQAPLPLASPATAAESRFDVSLPSLLDGLRILGQVDATFIVAENSRALLIVDQHVAHERIIYERLRDSRGAAPVERQPLLSPETLHLDRRSAERLAERLPELAEIGFDLEPFGGDSFLVRCVPAAVRGRGPLQFLKDIADELADGLGQGCATPARDEIYILCACKMAVKAGDKLGMAEMEKLLQDLAETENPYLCPHGRPITIVIPKMDLLRKFKRA